MAQSSGSRTPATNAVVRPLSRAAGRPCARPGCPSPSRATLVFRYGAREAFLGPLSEERTPEAYDLCANHADRTRPPHGWRFVDERPDESQGGPEDADFGGERTVAVLAAALHGDDVEDPSPALDDDPLREALEELQAVAVRMAHHEDRDRPLRLVDLPAADPADGVTLRLDLDPELDLDLELDLDAEHESGSDPVSGAEREGTDGASRAGSAHTPPGRQVPAARERRTDPGAVTLW